MIPYLDLDQPFPDVSLALLEPNGLLCAGADLSPSRLMRAYQSGIFPWFSDGEPILWWSPDPRCVIECNEIHISRSMKRVLNQQTFEIRTNTAFDDVVLACAEPRVNRDGDIDGTWITDEMIQAYQALYELGRAHSVECWQDGHLVGGVYGIQVGRVFCGESMFSRARNASKAALIHLAHRNDLDWIDCQVPNDHLYSMGAKCISREQFIHLLKEQKC